MDQGRSIWPNAWKKTRWDFYDIGLLPGKAWVNRWKASSINLKQIQKKEYLKLGGLNQIIYIQCLLKKKVKEIKKKLNPKKKNHFIRTFI